jgi:hypothetical protein
MTWFWLNHFSVFQYKANLRWLIGDYEERAIRPYVFGHFSDLVMATLQHALALDGDWALAPAVWDLSPAQSSRIFPQASSIDLKLV